MTRPFSIDDISRYERITDVAACRVSDRVAYCVESVHGDTYCSAIWIAGGEESPWQLTAGTALETAPQWAPDGSSLAFLSDRQGGAPQIYRVPLRGGEARQITRLPHGVQSFMWSPDGASLLAVALTEVAPPEATHGKRRAEGVHVVTEVPYKLDGAGFTLNPRAHLFVVEAATGEHRQVTHGRYEVRHAAWSPDGQTVYYTRTREGRLTHRTDIWAVRQDGSDMRQLTEQVAIVQDPQPSPDGRCLVFAGSESAGDSQTRLWRVDLQSVQVNALGSEDLEIVSGKSLSWAEGSDAVYVIAARNGLQEVARIDVVSGAYQTLVAGQRHVSAMAMTRDRLYFCATSIAEPEQLYACLHSGEHEQQVSATNAWWYERTRPDVRYEPFVVRTDEGREDTVWAWVIRPPQPCPAEPLLLDFHGGPASYVLLAYASHPYWNILWSHGWTIVAVNAVGSSSFGRTFCDRLRGRWGELDLPQHLAVADALHEHGAHNGAIAAAGKSYGGYLSAWAACTTDRLKAAVVSAPVADLRSHFGTSDSGPYADPYALGGSPWEAVHTYDTLSPIYHAPRATTPMLLLQGMDDERCPRGQSEQLFATLARSDAAPAELVLYPGGGHHFFESGRPSYREDAAARVVDWLTRWLGLGAAIE